MRLPSSRATPCAEARARSSHRRRRPPQRRHARGTASPSRSERAPKVLDEIGRWRLRNVEAPPCEYRRDVHIIGDRSRDAKDPALAIDNPVVGNTEVSVQRTLFNAVAAAGPLIPTPIIREAVK